MSEPVEAPVAVEPVARYQWMNLPLKIVGGALMVPLGAMTALYEVMYAPTWAGGVRLPVSLVLAVVLNPLLAVAAYWCVGRRIAALLPAVPWCAVWLVAASKTREGDLLINNTNWVGLVTLLAGPISFALAVFIPLFREQQKILRTSSPVPAGPPSTVPAAAVAAVATTKPVPGAKPAEAGKKRKASSPPLRSGGRKR